MSDRGLFLTVTAGLIAILACSSGGGPSTSPPPPPSLGPLPTQPPAAPTIVSMNPDTLVEGDTVVIRGTGFGSVPAEVAVTIGGLPAPVFALRSPETVVVTVPQRDCAPFKSEPLTVRIAGTASVPVLQPVRRSPAPTALAVGETRVVGTAQSHCVYLSPAGGTAEYLVGMQRSFSATGTAALQGFLTTGDFPDTRPPAMASRVASRVQRSPVVSPARSLNASFSGRAQSIESNVNVGDTIPIRVVTPVASSCNAFIPITTVVSRVGQWAIWLTDVENAAVGFSEMELSALSQAFDNIYYPSGVALLGQPTDRDGNGRVMVVITKEVNKVFPGLGGFTVGCDLFSRQAVAGSNEGEYMMLNVPDPTGVYGAVNPIAQVATANLIVAHEFAHVIQFGRRLTPTAGIGNMGTVLTEAQALIAEEVSARVERGLVDHVLGYAESRPPAGGETDWFSARFTELARYFGNAGGGSPVPGAPEQCAWTTTSPAPCSASGRHLYFAVGWTFLRWVTDQYGQALGGENGFHRALVDAPASAGIDFALIASVAGVPADTLLAGWAAALYLDDREAGLDPRHQFLRWNLWDIFGPAGRQAPTGGIPAMLQRWNTASRAVQVSPGSTAYTRVTGDRAVAGTIKVRTPSGGVPTGVQMFVIRVK